MSDPNERARAQRARAILEEELVPALDFAHEWGLRVESLEAIEHTGGIFWTEHGGERYCMRCLLEVEPTAATKVCLALGCMSSSLKHAFWMRRHATLDGETAVEAIKHARLNDVVRLARLWPEI